MASEEVDFLKNQVQRLNAELSKYRGQSPEAVEDLESSLLGSGPPAPWLTDKSVLFPLIAEYDQQINELQEQVKQYEAELGSIRPKVSQLMTENKKLSENVREGVTSQLGPISVDDLEPLQGDEQVLHNFQAQAECALKEKDAAIERWQEAEQEVDRLQQQLQAEKDSHQWGVIEQQAQQMRSEYYQSMTVLNQEIEQLQQDLRATKQELEICSIQLKESRKTNKDLEQQLSWKDQEVSEVIFKEGIADTKMIELKRIMDEMRRKLTAEENEMEELRRDKGGLEVRISEMQKRSTDVEQRESEAINQIRESAQLVENMLLDKEQAEIAVQQKEEELDQMREALNKIINEAGARTRQEVDTVRSQCNERISKLTEEVHTLEMDNAEKKDYLERALRDKRAAEAELERMYKEGSVQSSKDKGTFEDMNRRAITAERARDEAELKVDSLQQALKLEQLNGAQSKEQLTAQLNAARDRLAQLEQEFENVNDDRMRMMDESDEMKKKVQGAQQEKEAAQRKYQKEITIYEQDLNMKLRDYEVKLQTTEDTNRHTMTELRKLLTAQQRMTARWKEECQTVAEKFENKLNDSRGEVSQLKKRNSELTALLRESQDKTLEAEKMIADYTRGIRRMEERMRESENRAADASRKLSRQMIRERQAVSDRKSLMQELQRSTMAASNRSRQDPGELLLGDLAGSQHSHLNGSVRKTEIDDFISDR